MNYRRTLVTAINMTLPVFAGYMAIGIAFGLMLNSIGYGFGWAFFMSLIIYAGSGQFLGVELLNTAAALSQVALLTFLLNFRHVVYGISLLDKFRGMGLRKPYMIFSLTDETYALLSSVNPPKDIPPKQLYFSIAVLDHLYWITGSVVGCIAGSLTRFNTQGIEFTMTALFIVIAVEQWKTNKNHLPVFIGAGCTVISRLIFGGSNMLLPALFLIVALLLTLRQRLTSYNSEGNDCI